MSDIQSAYATLMQVDKLLADIELKITNITGESSAKGGTSSGRLLSLKQQVRILDTMLMLIQISTGDKNIDKAVQKFQKLIGLLMRLRMVMLAVESASGPWGWAYAAANIAAFGIMTTDFAMNGTG